MLKIIQMHVHFLSQFLWMVRVKKTSPASEINPCCVSPHQSCHRGLTLLHVRKHMWYFLTPTDGGSPGGLSMAEYFMNQTHYFCGSPAYVLEDLTMPGEMGMKISLLVMTSASYTCCWFQPLWCWAIFMRHKYIYIYIYTFYNFSSLQWCR